jgi:hypothetical protein
VTREVARWSDVPRSPGLYAMYGGEGRRAWVAYVGIAGDLNTRLTQHFLRRDSSVVTRTSAVGVNVEHVSYVEWWDAALLADETARHAAELVAFDVLDPALRSRGAVRREAQQLKADPAFSASVADLLAGEPAGRMVLPRVADSSLRLSDVEQRLARLERSMREAGITVRE